jgi:hypothetical protein
VHIAIKIELFCLNTFFYSSSPSEKNNDDFYELFQPTEIMLQLIMKKVFSLIVQETLAGSENYFRRKRQENHENFNICYDMKRVEIFSLAMMSKKVFFSCTKIEFLVFYEVAT